MRPFDMIMTWPKRWNFISWFITWITRGGPSHVRVYCKGLFEDFEFFEVTFPRGRFGYMNEIDPKYYKVEIGRHSELFYPLPKELSDKGLKTMISLSDIDYDVGELAFSQLFDELGIDHTDQSSQEKFVCSSGAEHILASMNFPFCPSEQLVSPQDIRKSKFYVKVEV